MGPKKVEFLWPIHYGLLDYNSFNEKKKSHKAKGYTVHVRAVLAYGDLSISEADSTTAREQCQKEHHRQRESELGLDREREKEEEEEEEDEHMELCGYGSQAHQCEPLLRRQFHQPSRAQPNHSVTTLHFSHSLFKPLLSDLLLLFFFHFYLRIWIFSFCFRVL